MGLPRSRRGRVKLEAESKWCLLLFLPTMISGSILVKDIFLEHGM